MIGTDEHDEYGPYADAIEEKIFIAKIFEK